MRCKYCGGEINLSVSRCVRCGRSVDESIDIRILHDLGALTEKYGLDPNASKYDLPEERKEPQQVMDQRTEAQHHHKDLKTSLMPGIELQTYYELLGEDGQLSEDAREDTAAPETEETEHAVQDADKEETPEEKSDIRKKLELLLDKVDTVTAPVTERVRRWYGEKTPVLKRAISSSRWERLAVAGLMLAAGVVVIVLVAMIIASIPARITGEWQVSDDDARSMFTVEFSGGDVTARVYGEDGEPHIYKKGTYDTSRKNGMDLLTIVYEDGSMSHLYYEINGRTGEFVNVDTGSSDTYRRIK